MNSCRKSQSVVWYNLSGKGEALVPSPFAEEVQLMKTKTSILSLGAAVGGLAVLGAPSLAAATYYYGKNATAGVVEDSSLWYEDVACTRPAGDYPKAGDVAVFSSATEVAVESQEQDLPYLSWRTGADVVLRLPAGSVTRCRGTDETKAGFGVPWDMGQGRARLTLAQGTLDLCSTAMTRNNSGTPQFFVLGATVRNCTSWRPSQLAVDVPCVTAFGRGAQVESFRFYYPTVKETEARAAFLAGDAGTTVSNLTLDVSRSTSYVGDAAFSNGVTVLDSTLSIPRHGRLKLLGPDTVISNTVFRTYANSDFAVEMDGVTWHGGDIFLSGVASNEMSTNHVFVCSNTTFCGSAGFYSPPYSGPNGRNRIVFGPNVRGDFGHAPVKIDNVTYYSGLVLRGRGDEITLTGDSRIYLTNTVESARNDTLVYGCDKAPGGSLTIERGTKVFARAFQWDAGATNATVAIDGEGTELTILANASKNGNPSTRILYGGTAGTGNVFRVSNGAKLSILADPAVKYDPNYDCGFCFTKGDHWLNRFEIDNASVTNDRSFFFGDNYYGGGGSNELAVVNGGRYESPMRIAMHKNTRGSRVRVENAVMRVSRIEMQPDCVLRVGGTRGGVTAAYLLNASAAGERARLEFAIPREGRDRQACPGALLVLTEADRPLRDKSSALDNPAFDVSFDISDRWAAYKLKRRDDIDLVSVPTGPQAKAILESLIAKADPAELKGCELSVVDTDGGWSVLRLSPTGTKGLMVTIR